MKKYNKEWLQELCSLSYSYAEVLAKAGRSKTSGGAHETLKKKIIEYGIDISHFTGQRWYDAPGKESNFKGQKREKYSLDEIFIKDSLVNQKALRRYSIKYHVLEYKCQQCGCDGHWQDGVIALELHHIDGNKTNNEKSNLCYLCPNCHALTENYRGKNKALKK